MTNAQIARKLRAVAKRAEEVETEFEGSGFSSHRLAGTFFTCTEVAKEFGSFTRDGIGTRVSRAYKIAMLGGFEEENELWLDTDIASIRVLLVCFAAALAETGDLLPA